MDGVFRTFGLDKGNSKVSNNCLFVEGRKLMTVEELPRRAPHDISNALAAALQHMQGPIMTQSLKP